MVNWTNSADRTGSLCRPMGIYAHTAGYICGWHRESCRLCERRRQLNSNWTAHDVAMSGVNYRETKPWRQHCWCGWRQPIVTSSCTWLVPQAVAHLHLLTTVERRDWDINIHSNYWFHLTRLDVICINLLSAVILFNPLTWTITFQPIVVISLNSTSKIIELKFNSCWHQNWFCCWLGFGGAAI